MSWCNTDKIEINKLKKEKVNDDSHTWYLHHQINNFYTKNLGIYNKKQIKKEIIKHA